VSARWQDGIEVIAFLKPDVSDDQLAAIRTMLDESPDVDDDWKYVNREESHAEAMRLFERNEAMKAKLEADPELVPDSYRMKPASAEINIMESLGAELAAQEGVLQVKDVSDSVKTVKGVSNAMQSAMLVIGVGLLVAALLLILNAIRMAMFARRREIEVMKLVGASDGFVRTPFVLEGLLQGVVGSTLAALAVIWVNYLFVEWAHNALPFVPISANAVTAPFLILLLVAVGVAIGVIGSFLSVTRYLRKI
jgi:cell division transport system permease protein